MTAERASMTLNEVSVPTLGTRSVATRPPGPATPLTARGDRLRGPLRARPPAPVRPTKHCHGLLR